MTNKILLITSQIALSVFLLALCVVSAQAGAPVYWTTNSRADLLKGEARGVSVTDTGALILAPGFTQLFNTEQAYIWSSVADRAGNIYLGTGHDGRIFRVTPDGRGALFYDAAELDVTALAIGADGALYAGTSPEGKVYRITSDGRAEVYFDPPDKYIWSLATMADGSLAVGTGDNGRLYRVRTAGAKPENSLLIDINETHVISLAVDAQGQLLAGTDPGGLVLRISPEGKAFALFDSPLREIHALIPRADGSIYALALSETASASRVSTTPVPQPAGGGAGAPGTTSVSVTVTPVDDSGAQQAAASPPAARSRNDLTGARCAVFRILPDGGIDTLWSSTSVTAFAIATQGSRVLIGTNDKGRIYAVTDDGRDTLLLQSTEDQISSFVTHNNEIYAASSNQGKLFRLSAELSPEGTYESAVRDAKFVASWGRIWWRGEGRVELQTRSGNTERPDATWSEWSPAYRDPNGAQIASPRARFIQWRATLRATARGTTAGAIARVEDVSLAYLPRNVAPEVLAITSLPMNVGLQPAIQAQTDPNVEASGLDPSLFGAVAQAPPRRLYQRGALSLQWQAEDRNGDKMEYAVYYRALNESGFHLLKDKLRDTFYTVDGAALADGRYVFKIVASDAPDNPPGLALTGERASEPIDIDNTPPVIRQIGQTEIIGDRVRVQFDVEDASSMVKSADVSTDGGPWRALYPEDGIADSQRERYTLELPMATTGAITISLRAFDMNGNVGSIRLTVQR